jgi:hypothetical protein
MQMRMEFLFFFYEQREEGKIEEIKQSRTTKAHQSNWKPILVVHN